MQGRFPGTFRALSTCRGSAIPNEATYRRVILSDATPCPKRGSFKPSINPAADHETGLVRRDRACKRTRPKENPPKREPAQKENPPKREPARENPRRDFAQPRRSNSRMAASAPSIVSRGAAVER